MGLKTTVLWVSEQLCKRSCHFMACENQTLSCKTYQSSKKPHSTNGFPHAWVCDGQKYLAFEGTLTENLDTSVN